MIETTGVFPLEISLVTGQTVLGTRGGENRRHVREDVAAGACQNAVIPDKTKTSRESPMVHVGAVPGVDGVTGETGGRIP